jgi:hypothetical protein
MTFSVPAADRAAAVEQLRTRAFPAQRERAGAVVSSPAFHWAELARTPVWEGDPAEREAGEERAEAECQALSGELSELWHTEPQTFSLMSLLVRETGGEELPEPWSSLGRSVPELHLWRMADRWIGIGISGRAEDHERTLVAVVTATDPP